MFELRVQMRATLLQSILPPAVFVFIALGALGLANAIIMPMVGLMWNLTGLSWRRGGFRTPLAIPSEAEHAVLWVAAVVLAVWVVMSIVILLRATPVGVLLGGLTNYSQRRTPLLRSLFFRLFRWAYILLTLAILLAAMLLIAGPCGLLLWMATVVIALMIKVRVGDMERRSLFWSLAVAIEKGIPLPAAAQAFAAERRDKLGRQARRLAQLLEDGAPLDAALCQSVRRIPNDVLLGLRAGADSRGMASRLKNAGRGAAHLDGAMNAAIARMVYLILFLCFAAGVIAYLAIDILPAFQKIFADFHTTLPPTTTNLIGALAFAEHYPGGRHLPCWPAYWRYCCSRWHDTWESSNGTRPCCGGLLCRWKEPRCCAGWPIRSTLSVRWGPRWARWPGNIQNFTCAGNCTRPRGEFPTAPIGAIAWRPPAWCRRPKPAC